MATVEHRVVDELGHAGRVAKETAALLGHVAEVAAGFFRQQLFLSTIYFCPQFFCQEFFWSSFFANSFF
jgi:hypothetical protein